MTHKCAAKKEDEDEDESKKKEGPDSRKGHSSSTYHHHRHLERLKALYRKITWCAYVLARRVDTQRHLAALPFLSRFIRFSH